MEIGDSRRESRSGSIQDKLAAESSEEHALKINDDSAKKATSS
jgi:hypothetical protein